GRAGAGRDHPGAGSLERAHRLESVRPDQGVAAWRLPGAAGRRAGTEPQPAELPRRGRAGCLLAGQRGAGPGLLARQDAAGPPVRLPRRPAVPRRHQPPAPA
ncbi:hypothetical protein LTR94_035345, partial [Friedmanniomyces endolithicus]